jgi:hypothetical protein
MYWCILLLYETQKDVLAFVSSWAFQLTVEWYQLRNIELINYPTALRHLRSDWIHAWPSSSCTKLTPVMDCCCKSLWSALQYVVQELLSTADCRLSGINDGMFVLRDVYDESVSSLKALRLQKCPCCLSLALCLWLRFVLTVLTWFHHR